MKKAGLLESPRRGYFCITSRGLKILAKNPPEINVSFLEQCKYSITPSFPSEKTGLSKKADIT
jgi:restriction endonuclease Mrr